MHSGKVERLLLAFRRPRVVLGVQLPRLIAVAVAGPSSVRRGDLRFDIQAAIVVERAEHSGALGDAPKDLGLGISSEQRLQRNGVVHERLAFGTEQQVALGGREKVGGGAGEATLGARLGGQ